MTTYWAPLLHAYQPPTQDISILRKIDKECYKPLFSMLEEHDNVKICLNISGILIELLREFDLEDTIELVQNLVADQKLEILGTAKFHPILPLIPEKEAQRQILLNEDVNRKEFNNWEKNGFFPPELSISSKVAKFIRQSGYKWVIMSGLACPIEWPYEHIYSSPNGLKLFFRDDILSNKVAFNDITAKEFVEKLNTTFNEKNENKHENRYFITAMDSETFGHHIKKFERTFLSKTLELINDQSETELVFISELDKHFPIHKEKIVPRDSSWSTTHNDMKVNIPYPLWNHPDNTIHKLYWKIMKNLNNLMSLIGNLDTTQDWEVENYCNTARWFYDRGICSDSTWWANPDRGTWSPNLIYKGIELLMRSALNAQLGLVHANQSNLGEEYFDSISFYHNLLLMEMYSITKKNLKNQED
jgi:alpha-amylase/alpha-mannosidase (GH57 family)